MDIDVDTLERLVPDEVDRDDRAGQESLELHIARYRFAAEHARPGRLLDIACGAGYGSRLLADSCSDLSAVLGVDISPEAVEYATHRYGNERLRFLVAEAMEFSDPKGFDSIVSLETMEHLVDPHAFYARLVGMLRPGGVLVASVPTTPSVDLNPHHRHDFSAGAFRRLGASHDLVEVGSLHQVQRMGLSELYAGHRFRRQNLRRNLLSFYVSNPGALMKRLWTTLRIGFANHYLALAWRRSDGSSDGAR